MREKNGTYVLGLPADFGGLGPALVGKGYVEIVPDDAVSCASCGRRLA